MTYRPRPVPATSNASASPVMSAGRKYCAALKERKHMVEVLIDGTVESTDHRTAHVDQPLRRRN